MPVTDATKDIVFDYNMATFSSRQRLINSGRLSSPYVQVLSAQRQVDLGALGRSRAGHEVSGAELALALDEQ
jgi:hypothetical protein